jgi:hypothetical protein
MAIGGQPHILPLMCTTVIGFENGKIIFERLLISGMFMLLGDSLIILSATAKTLATLIC